MALIEVHDLHFRYPDEPQETLRGLTFSVKAGEFIVLCGPTGCGKTTLLRHLKTELAPVGERSGSIVYDGESVKDHSPKRLAHEIGMVMQDPDSQIVMEQVAQELYFTLENVGCPPETMRRRVAEMAHFFGLERWLQRKTYELSGGQRQLLNLASVLLLHPRVLLFDEPTAQLDPISAREFLQMVHQLNRELGMTVILSEHRLEDVFPLADRVLFMEAGMIRHEGLPKQVIRRIWSDPESQFHPYLPAVPRLFLKWTDAESGRNGIYSGKCELKADEVDRADTIPLTVKEGRDWLRAIKPGERGNRFHSKKEEDIPSESVIAKPFIQPQQTILQCKSVFFQYDKQQPFILQNCTLEVHENEFLAVLGGNGSGKSTLLQAMVGLLTPQGGEVNFRGRAVRKIEPTERFSRIGYLSQNPLLHFAHETVAEQLRHAAQRAGRNNAEQAMERMADLFRLDGLGGRHPHDLSGGERQKLALAGVLVSEPQLLLLDEPTKGLDPQAKRELADLLQELRRQGLTIVMATHDIEFAAAYAERCALLFDARITAEGAPAPFFSENYFYTTAINRWVRDELPSALTEEDVLERWNDPGSLL